MGGLLFASTGNYITSETVIKLLESENKLDEGVISYFCSHQKLSQELLKIMIDHSTCVDLSKLKYGDNLISYFTKANFDLLSRITYLNISGINLTVKSIELLTKFTHFSNVITLDLSNNNLTAELNNHMMALFQRFSSLKILDISYNRLTKVNFSFFTKSLQNVCSVILKGNSIELNTSTFGLLPKYKVLFKDARLLYLKNHLINEIFEYSNICKQEEIYSKFKNKKLWNLRKSYKRRSYYLEFLKEQAVKAYEKKISDFNQHTEICSIKSTESIQSLTSAIVQNQIMVIAGLKSGVIEIFDISLSFVQRLGSRKSSVNALIVLNNDILACGSSDAIIRLWNLNTYKSAGELRYHKKCISDLKVTNLNNIECLVSCGLDFEIAIWNIREKKVAFTLMYGETQHSVTASLKDTSDILYTGGSNDDFKIYKWNLSNKKVSLLSTKGHLNYVTSLQAYKIENKDYLISTCFDTEVKVWDAPNLYLIYIFSGFPQSAVQTCIFKSGEITYLASTYLSTKSMIWDLSTKNLNEPVAFLIAKPELVNALISIRLETTSILISGGKEGTIRIWKV